MLARLSKWAYGWGITCERAKRNTEDRMRCSSYIMALPNHSEQSEQLIIIHIK